MPRQVGGPRHTDVNLSVRSQVDAHVPLSSQSPKTQLAVCISSDANLVTDNPTCPKTVNTSWRRSLDAQPERISFRQTSYKLKAPFLADRSQ